jgi:hypothetical protein
MIKNLADWPVSQDPREDDVVVEIVPRSPHYTVTLAPSDSHQVGSLIMSTLRLPTGSADCL